MSTNQYLPPQGRAGASDLPPISEDEFAATVEQVRNHQRDADRMRLLRNLVLSYTMSCEQTKAFVEEVEFTEAKVELAVLLFGATRERERYDPVVLSSLRFEEQRDQVRTQCGFGAAKAAPVKSAPAPAPAMAAGPAKDATSWMKKKKADSDDSDDDDDD